MGSGAKSYTVRKGFLILYMRRPLVMYDFAPDPIWISLYMRKILFSFLSVYSYTNKLEQLTYFLLFI